MSEFKYSFDNKRYHTYNYHLKKTFSFKCIKICLNAGFTCPNRDGNISNDGCLFCSDGAISTLTKGNDDLMRQYHDYKLKLQKKWDCRHFIAYFQAFSNTYAPLEELIAKYQPFLELEEVVALNIATRADCLDKEILDYLEKTNKIKPIYLELGLQTVNEETAKIINRGYTFEVFKNSVFELKKRNINVVIHLINGLPHETKADNLLTIREISKLPIDGIKFHSLFINYQTKLYDYYKKNPWNLLTLEDYLDILICQLELLPPHVVIHRISGDPNNDNLFYPNWAVNKTNLRNCLDKEMKKRNTHQGKYFFY